MTISQRRSILIVVFLIAFALLACDDPAVFDQGVTHVCQNGSELVIFASVPPDIAFNQTFPTTAGTTRYAYYASYVHVSRDGGLFWRTLPDLLPDEPDLIAGESVRQYRDLRTKCMSQAPYTGYYRYDYLSFPTEGALDADGLDVRLRWFVDDRIEVSSDNGVTWQTEFELEPLRQEVRDFYHQIRGDETNYIVSVLPAPISATYDPTSGNVLFALGFDGLLVREPSGAYQWVAVGNYGLRNLQISDLWTGEGGGDDYFSVPLGFHYFLMAALAALVLVSTIAIIQRSGWLARIMLALGWIGWVVLVVLAKPIGTLDAIIIPGMLALGLTIIPAIPMTLWALGHLFSNYIEAWKAVLMTALLANIAFVVPMALWATGMIYAYWMSAAIALLATAGVLVFCYDYFVPRLPQKVVVEKEKRKNDDIKPKNQIDA